MNRVKSTHEGFEEAFRSLPKNKILEVRKEIMDALDWSVSLFYYKKRGDTPLWQHEEKPLEKIFNRFKINVWTGKTK